MAKKAGDDGKWEELGLGLANEKKEKADFSRSEADFGNFKALAHRTNGQL